MQIEFINKSEKRRIIEKISQQYGINELPFLLIKTGKDRTRGFTGSLSKEEILNLARHLNIEVLGLYLFKEEKDGLRLSFSSANILPTKKNIVEISDEQAEEWLKGRNIPAQTLSKGYVVLKNKNDFLGCGKASDGRIANFVPKERRIKN